MNSHIANRVPRTRRTPVVWVAAILCLFLLTFAAYRGWRAYRIQQLISELDWANDRDPRDRESASAELVKIGLPAVKPLIASLRDSRSEVRTRVLGTLVKIGEPAVGPLISTMREEEGKPAVGNIGFLTQKALIEIGGPSVRPLAGLLEDPSENLRMEAIAALGQMKDPSATAALIAALKSPDAGVRSRAAFGLGKTKDKDGVEPLIAALQDAEPDVRQQAAFALGQMDDPRKIEALTAVLDDPDPTVRAAASNALQRK